jgi:hypothetical protein
LIVEVETADSINIAHTRGQWAAFANYAWRVRGIFRVVVPPYALGAAQAAARLWGIPVGEFRGEDGRSKAA